MENRPILAKTIKCQLNEIDSFFKNSLDRE